MVLKKFMSGIKMQNNLPKITVVTVTYNAEQYLEQTIKSVIAQDYPNIEYVVIDGASSDKTVDIIKQYEKYISYWISESDTGIYDAMNKGIDVATGEWINFMNAGDLFSKNSILKDIFYKNYDSSVLYSDTYIINKNLDIIHEYKAEKLENFFISKMPFTHQSSFTKLDVISNFPFRRDYKLASDFDLFFKLYIKKYKFEYLPNIKISKFLIDGLHAFNMIKYTSEALNSLFTEYPKTQLLIKNSSIIESLDKYNNECFKNFSTILSSTLLNIDSIINQYNRVVLYGYGSLGKLLYSHYSNKITGIIDKSFIDKNSSLPIIKLDEINKYEFDTILISLINREKGIIEELIQNGIPRDKISIINQNFYTFL
ncbi:glycosyltransferase family 2 protein [Aliarcobacter lanthieri]|uniref:glycosyltransferase family 2 protein n=1 Tax=Aliarcobacter lanthieri TaxID=1355374 RepID=UPI003AADF6A2